MMLCTRCKKRPAMFFVSKIENGERKDEGLCLNCARELGVIPIDDIMKKFNISEEDLENFSEQFADAEEDSDTPGFEQGGSPSLPNFIQSMFSSLGNKAEGQGEDKNALTEKSESRQKNSSAEQKGGRDEKKKNIKRKFLDNYCDNLTRKAQEGKLDNIVGRDKEIERTIQILSRRQKNNPCLIGEAGVGKTAIAEGIALRIASGNVPSRIRDKEICLLDLTSLVAGTQFRGQFESRIKGLIDEVKALGNIILFIDEIHNITGAGDADGAMSAANILKPALSRGEIQVIGATTFAEYRKFIEKDQALERRFQPVKIEEPSAEDSVNILMGIRQYYEEYHGVKYSDAVIKLCVALSERYISDRFLPDKAIDLMDESGACRALRCPELTEYRELLKKQPEIAEQQQTESENENPDYEKISELKSESLRIEQRIAELEPTVANIGVTSDDLAKVIELWTGIPANRVEQSEYKKVAGLEAALKKHIIGQDEAVEAVAMAMKRTRVGLSTRIRPASFIFVGPTGVGKTELVKVLAQELFDSVDPLIRIDMSEYMEKHTVARLIGSPPGYVGYDEAGQLTEKVRRRPYSVVLFDEIEKAHPDVMNVLLQILDEGRVTDGQGRTVNFEHTVICMTSNAGSTENGGLAGFGQTIEDMNSDKMVKALSDFLRPEFLSRVDEVIVFKPLSQESMAKIASLMLDELKTPLLEKMIVFEYDEKATAALAKLAGGGKYGARDMRRTIRKQVEDKIANLLVENVDSMPTQINLSADENGELVITSK